MSAGQHVVFVGLPVYLDWIQTLAVLFEALTVSLDSFKELIRMRKKFSWSKLHRNL